MIVRMDVEDCCCLLPVLESIDSLQPVRLSQSEFDISNIPSNLTTLDMLFVEVKRVPRDTQKIRSSSAAIAIVLYCSQSLPDLFGLSSGLLRLE